MPSLGNAGTVWTRHLATRVANKIPGDIGGGFDWAWSEMLKNENITMYALSESAVMHLGIILDFFKVFLTFY